MSEELTAARLAEIERLCTDGPGHPDDIYEAMPVMDALHDALIEVVAELAALREATRWRTVSADGLPESKAWVVMRHVHDGPYLGHYDAVAARWSLDGGMKAEPQPTDRWVPIPGESE